MKDPLKPGIRHEHELVVPGSLGGPVIVIRPRLVTISVHGCLRHTHDFRKLASKKKGA
jgi:G:T-mismatch repair DNA endonuclease (very short patch repair protein)